MKSFRKEREKQHQLRGKKREISVEFPYATSRGDPTSVSYQHRWDKRGRGDLTPGMKTGGLSHVNREIVYS